MCPKTFKFYKLKDVKDLIEKDVNEKDPSKRLLNFSKEEIKENSTLSSTDEILCFFEGRLYRYRQLKSLLKKMDLSKYQKFIGNSLASKIALVVQLDE